MTKKLDEDQLNHISPAEGFDILQRDSRALFIDIRSNMEFLFVGHPRGAIHVPWIDEPDWTVNKDFVREIRQLLLGGVSQDHGSPPIILICRSGKRSKEAGETLVKAGIKNVCHISEGFEGDLDEQHHRSAIGGWRFRGLPWEQC
ncbi:MAG: rhodanese-like domain-containing protein [Gammaproteobacteria bacterium]|jgi:rhodanese-related sulfurtransferase|nr:rhodanese-like domain-containing protein [Gammaproteobacteria bacterium]